MSVIDLADAHRDSYFHCLEDWSDEMKESGGHKATWYSKYKDKGLRVKIAVDDDGHPGGMIQYLPIEESSVEGQGLYFIPCIWVHGHKEGRGNFQKKGMGSALLEAAEADARSLGAKGMAAWGLWLPFWMKASWFKKHGYRKADRDSMKVLVWKKFEESAEPPKWIREKKKPVPVPGKVTVTAFLNGWCPASNITYERAKRAATELGDRVLFQSIDTSNRETLLEWGISDAVFINGKQIWAGPPPSFEKLRKMIAKKL
jgi:GNAT superfamily N-acetyltransferase